MLRLVFRSPVWGWGSQQPSWALASSACSSHKDDGCWVPFVSLFCLSSGSEGKEEVLAVAFQKPQLAKKMAIVIHIIAAMLLRQID